MSKTRFVMKKITEKNLERSDKIGKRKKKNKQLKQIEGKQNKKT